MAEKARDFQQDARRVLKMALRDPDEVAGMTDVDLDLTLRVARRARLLGRLAADLQASGSLEIIAPVAREQLLSALALAESRARLGLWELDRIAWALSPDSETSPIVLKGCAYLLLDLPNARGRIFADVDLLVPEKELEDLEIRLTQFGWKTNKLSPYDQNYYRKWTHELPPLIHWEREVEIDLHHNLVPRTARLNPPPHVLTQAAVTLQDSKFQVLNPQVMVLHAMTHLMFDGDLADKFRDLVDIDDLLRHFDRTEHEFWQRLLVSAEHLDLKRPAFYSVRYVKQLLKYPVPEFVLEKIQYWGPPAPVVYLMDCLVPLALYPPHPDHHSHSVKISRFLLYIRSHWIRMPPWLLAYHLGYKFFVTRIRRSPRPEAEANVSR